MSKREVCKVLINHVVELEDENDVQGQPRRPLKASEALCQSRRMSSATTVALWQSYRQSLLAGRMTSCAEKTAARLQYRDWFPMH